MEHRSEPRGNERIVVTINGGEVISVEYGGQKSRFKVVWIRDSQSHQLIQAAIHLMKAETCPWKNT